VSHTFRDIVDEQLRTNGEDNKTVMIVATKSRALTNAVFLVGSYMIMRHRPDDIDLHFEPIRSRLLAYRDVSPGEPNFALHLKDCWAGLWRARWLGWADLGLGRYAHLDSPLNADLREVVPGKLFAMRGPRDLPRGAI
jgi:hypothetical protein